MVESVKGAAWGAKELSIDTRGAPDILDRLSGEKKAAVGIIKDAVFKRVKEGFSIDELEREIVNLEFPQGITREGFLDVFGEVVSQLRALPLKEQLPITDRIGNVFRKVTGSPKKESMTLEEKSRAVRVMDSMIDKLNRQFVEEAGALTKKASEPKVIPSSKTLRERVSSLCPSKERAETISGLFIVAILVTVLFLAYYPLEGVSNLPRDPMPECPFPIKGGEFSLQLREREGRVFYQERGLEYGKGNSETFIRPKLRKMFLEEDTKNGSPYQERTWDFDAQLSGVEGVKKEVNRLCNDPKSNDLRVAARTDAIHEEAKFLRNAILNEQSRRAQRDAKEAEREGLARYDNSCWKELGLGCGAGEQYRCLGTHAKELGEAYRAQSLKLHPDKRPKEEKRQAEEEFRGCRAAYERCSGKQSRKRR